jgi:hypothetical protein
MQELLACVDEARGERGAVVQRQALSGLPEVHYDATQLRLLHVAGVARWYWAAVVFEVLFFAGLIAFAFWPWIQRRGFRRKLLHVALLPLLLYLPGWLGYGYPAQTWFHGGGILYSFLNQLPLPLLGHYGWEKSFLDHLPPLFSSLSAVDRRMFADQRFWRGTLVGPVNVAVTLGFRWLSGLARRGRGFPVEVVKPGPTS